MQLRDKHLHLSSVETVIGPMLPLVLLIFLVLVLPVHADEARFSVPIADSPQKGPSDAAVTIIEFLDFQ